MRAQSLFENDAAAVAATWVLLGAWRVAGAGTVSGTRVGLCDRGHALRELGSDRAVCTTCAHEYGKQRELF